MSNYVKAFGLRVRGYAFCCPPRPPSGTCGCPPPVPGGARKIEPPADCRPIDIPYNPCVPHFPRGNPNKFKYIFFFLCVPLILFQIYNCVVNHCEEPKGECRDFEYMRRRTKRFPWGDGAASLYHNEHVNFLPGECVPPPLDCE